MGCKTLGETRTEGGTGSADIETVHVVYCYPTDLSILDREEYKKLMFQYVSPNTNNATPEVTTEETE